MNLIAIVAIHLTAILFTVLLVLMPTWLLFECGLPAADRNSGKPEERVGRTAA